MCSLDNTKRLGHDSGLYKAQRHAAHSPMAMQRSANNYTIPYCNTRKGGVQVLGEPGTTPEWDRRLFLARLVGMAKPLSVYPTKVCMAIFSQVLPHGFSRKGALLTPTHWVGEQREGALREAVTLVSGTHDGRIGS